MKKLFALLMVCGFAFAFAACGGKKAEEATTTEPATEETAPAQEAAPADSTAADSTAAQ
ncbi:MAG: hypothetical protein L6Q51_10350 [Cyclobacteriaceae bacterium]|nr:hypothetical protein [Cyclobacteriaceae bacterium]